MDRVLIKELCVDNWIRIRVSNIKKYFVELSGIKSKNTITHHLDSQSLFPELVFEPTNVVVLLEKFHKDFHSTYGYGNNTRGQFGEWKNENFTYR